MRRSNYLITDIRRDTENTGVSTTTAGISDEAILLSLNDGQTWLFSELEKTNPSPFTAQSFIDTVAGQIEYDLPSDTYLGSDVVSVSILRATGAGEYSRLQTMSLLERTASVTRGMPSRYFMRQNKIGLNPAPQSSLLNGLRVNYTLRRPRMDKRRAKIATATVTNGAVTALTLGVGDFETYFPGEESFSASRILVDDFFCVVDTAGNIKARKVPITAINETTGVCTLGTYTPEFDTDDATTNDYIVAGEYASSHSSLPNEAESFLVHFAKSQIFESDGNREEAGTASERAKLMGQTVISGWNKLVDDVEYVPLINPDNT